MTAVVQAAIAALVVVAAVGPADAAKKPARQQQLQTERKALQQRLARVQREVGAAEAARAEAADALRESEQAISAVNRRLREIGAERRRVQREIDVLSARSRVLTARRSDEQRSLSRALRGQYLLARADPWQRLIDGANPAGLSRDLAYLDHVARAHTRALAELRSRSEELAQLQAELTIKQQELAALADDEQQVHAELVKQQAARARSLERVSKQLAGQRRTLVSLQRDEQRLASLIEQLQRALAESAGRRRGSPSGERPPAVEVPADTAFARLRGKLVLPVRGQVVARFGSARPTEAQVDAPSWKGLFIRAAAGTDVHAVAAGRVVFADWLRGFGNLLVIDHGEGFLSVYGNNEALLASVGEQVGAAEAIATVGASGGAAEAGLYFELRFRGRPLDPQQWAQAR